MKQMIIILNLFLETTLAADSGNFSEDNIKTP